ncbi:unnamed protein product [marine sediment metagenome]|uniref:Uncharacterized protein n=1 Tax=marine sediment metagenome TaxID=412755 RepID=X0SVI6_9ZZZZ
MQHLSDLSLLYENKLELFSYCYKMESSSTKSSKNKKTMRTLRIIFSVLLLVGLVLLFIFGMNANIQNGSQVLESIGLASESPCAINLDSPECTTAEFERWCKASSSRERRSICELYCETVQAPPDEYDPNEYEGRTPSEFCALRNYCFLIGTDNSEFSVCEEIDHNFCSYSGVNECFADVPDPDICQPLGFCGSYDFNNVCFEALYETGNQMIIDSCRTTCLFPETLPNPFSEYFYCTVLPEYKKMSPCYYDFGSPECQNNQNITEAFCTNNEVWCPNIFGYGSDGDIINKCMCLCRNSNKYSLTPYCEANPPFP